MVNLEMITSLTEFEVQYLYRFLSRVGLRKKALQSAGLMFIKYLLAEQRPSSIEILAIMITIYIQTVSSDTMTKSLLLQDGFSTYEYYLHKLNTERLTQKKLKNKIITYSEIKKNLKTNDGFEIRIPKIKINF